MAIETASVSVLHESDLVTETGLPAREIHGRLVTLSRVQHRVESALAFYLLEVERRALFVELGHASTVDYARECLGLEDRKTRTLLGLACRLERLPKMKEAFGLGHLPYTKAREAVRVATPDTEEAWVEKCKTMSNRQIEQEVQRQLPPEQSRMLFFGLDESRIAVWDRCAKAWSGSRGRPSPTSRSGTWSAPRRYAPTTRPLHSETRANRWAAIFAKSSKGMGSSARDPGAASVLV